MESREWIQACLLRRRAHGNRRALDVIVELTELMRKGRMTEWSLGLSGS